MARPTKRPRALKCNDDNNPPRRSRRIAGQLNATISHLGDVLPKITEFFQAEELMCLRCVCKLWREEIKKTNVPISEFVVDSLGKYNAMNVMTEAIPNLQQITIGHLGYDHKYVDGEDPKENVAVRTADYTAHDIGIISNFSKLRILEIRTYAVLNGRYPFLFNSFPLLQKLSIEYCHFLKLDLRLLSGFPLLKEMYCRSNPLLTGNINSLRLLKDTLEKVKIYYCENVEGNFMDLADFPHLKDLNLEGTAVTGDIRDISDSDFLALERLVLPMGVYGGSGYEFQSISDGPDVVRAVYLLEKERPNLIESFQIMFWTLSVDSPDWYDGSRRNELFPFGIHFVKAGCRFGYRWESVEGYPCEVNWLDPEPDRETSDYEEYIKELQEINSKVNMYKGFHQPPTEEEYNRIVDEYYRRRNEEERRRYEEEEFYMRGLP